MKTVILLRHAEAAPTPVGGKDVERVLTMHGRAMATWVGGQMVQKGLWPDFILCSAAQRTKETCQHLMDVFAPDVYPQVFFDPAIYRADAHELLNMLGAQDDMHDAILMIGHNPTIHQLALMLCGAGQMQKKPDLATNFPPASSVILNFDAPYWADIRKGSGALVDYFYPAGSL